MELDLGGLERTGTVALKWHWLGRADVALTSAQHPTERAPSATRASRTLLNGRTEWPETRFLGLLNARRSGGQSPKAPSEGTRSPLIQSP